MQKYMRRSAPNLGSALSGTNTKPLFLHKGNSALLCCIQCIAKSTLTINCISKIVTHVGVDLVNRWSPLEIDIHLSGTGLKHLTDDLVAIERLRGVQQWGAQ